MNRFKSVHKYYLIKLLKCAVCGLNMRPNPFDKKYLFHSLICVLTTSYYNMKLVIILLLAWVSFYNFFPNMYTTSMSIIVTWSSSCLYMVVAIWGYSDMQIMTPYESHMYSYSKIWITTKQGLFYCEVVFIKTNNGEQ